jgi:hypothetical protein
MKTHRVNVSGGFNMFKISLAAIGFVVVLAGGVCAGGLDRGMGLDLAIRNPVLPEQHSVTIFRADGGITSGSYNSNTRTLWLSDPQNNITIGNEDSQGNIVIQEFGEEDGD